MHFMSYHPKYSTLAYVISCLLDAVDGPVARARGETSKFGAVLDMVTDRLVSHVATGLSSCLIAGSRCTTSCLLCYLASAYPDFAVLFQLLIALDFSSHYMHMYRSVSLVHSAMGFLADGLRSSLVTGSISHKLVKSDVSYILNMYYTDSVSFRDLGVLFHRFDLHTANSVYRLRRKRAFLRLPLRHEMVDHSSRSDIPSWSIGRR